MSIFTKQTLIVPLIATVCLAAPLPTPGQTCTACSIPVFRYALEQFPADPYHFVVYHRGPLTGEAQKAVDLLQKLSKQSPAAVNFDLQVVELDAAGAVIVNDAAPPPEAEETLPKQDNLTPTPTGGDLLALQSAQGGAAANSAGLPPPGAALPWLSITLPGGESPVVWSAPLAAQDVPAMFDSPVRREVARRLLHGESAVFLLLQCGRKDEDAKTARLLDDSIAKMQKSLKLPVDDGTGKPLSALPLKISFSVIAVRRDDPAEPFLVKTLLAAAGDQAKGPVVFPVFGRGRILGAIGGESLQPVAIEETGKFLCNGCSCSLKSELPGGDLLLAVNWDAVLQNRPEREIMPALPGLGTMAEMVRLSSGNSSSPASLAAAPAGVSAGAPPGPAAEKAAPAADVLPEAAVPAAGFALSYVVLATLAVVTIVIVVLTAIFWFTARRRAV